MTPSQPNTQEVLKAYFETLPEPVQNAILSNDLEKNLRSLAQTHKLHLDQWQVLESEVMFALLGVKPVEGLSSVIQTSLSLSAPEAAALTADISRAVFEPIREEMERTLGAPQAEKEAVTDIEQVRTELIEEAHHNDLLKAANTPIPSTPPPAPPEIKSVRTEITPEKVLEVSSQRKSIANDVYREQL